MTCADRNIRNSFPILALAAYVADYPTRGSAIRRISNEPISSLLYRTLVVLEV